MLEDAEADNRGPLRLGRGLTALAWANCALLISVLFFSGMFYQRVVELEVRVSRIQSTDLLGSQISDLRSEVSRLRDRLDKLIDQQAARDGDGRTRPGGGG